MAGEMTHGSTSRDASRRLASLPPARSYRPVGWRFPILVACLVLLFGRALPARELAGSITERRLDWIDSRYHASSSFLMMDDANKEMGFGLEVSGPDPFRDLSAGDDKKVAPNWRLGVNFFDYQDQNSLVNTKLTVLTLGAGWDYFMKGGGLEPETMSTPFLSAYLMGYLPDRTGAIPGRYDRSRIGVALGAGWQAKRIRARLEHTFLLDQETGVNNFTLGYQF